MEIRAKLIEADLNYVVSFTNPDLRPEERHYRTVYDPDTFNVQVSIFNGQTVVTASDENRPSPQVLATVTDTDAKYYGLTQDKVGELWRDRIQIRPQPGSAGAFAPRPSKPGASWRSPYC